MSLTSVAIIGANGNLGPSILNSLVTNQIFKITVLTRQSSKSTYPESVNTHRLPDTLPHDALISALTGQDALIIAVTGSLSSVSIQLINAAVEAKVKRIIPADFGSCDSSDPRSLSLIPLYPEKKKVRDHLVGLCAKNPTSSWTSIICGHFLDYGLQTGLMGFDVLGRKARIYDGGEKVFSASKLKTVGMAVVGILLHPEETRDRLIYVQSLATTQRELLAMVEKVVGGGKFEVEEVSSDEFIREKQRELKERPDDAEVTEELVSVEGIVNADWTGKDGFANELLGLPEEDLEKVVREALAGLS